MISLFVVSVVHIDATHWTKYDHADWRLFCSVASLVPIQQHDPLVDEVFSTVRNYVPVS